VIIVGSPYTVAVALRLASLPIPSRRQYWGRVGSRKGFVPPAVSDASAAAMNERSECRSLQSLTELDAAPARLAAGARTLSVAYRLHRPPPTAKAQPFSSLEEC